MPCVCSPIAPSAIRRSPRSPTIAAVTGITEQNIFKLIKTLTKAGLVETIRGPHGGVRLAMAPSAIRVGQVIRAIEPRFKACGPLDQIMSDEPVSAVERELDRTIGRGIAAFMETLDKTSIAALVAKTARERGVAPTSAEAAARLKHWMPAFAG